MNLMLQIGAQNYRVATDAIDISIPLYFNGEQPNSYGVDRATSEPFAGDGWLGDVRQGGSCNFEIYRLIPHCNGTHTECIGHITAQRFAVHQLLKDSFIPATLITIMPTLATETEEVYSPELHSTDKVITATAIHQALKDTDISFLKGLIIRTLPNDDDKLSREYSQDKYEPPFFSLAAMKLIRELGVQHLLVDMPSVDRLHDEGKLSTHHIYWEIDKLEEVQNPPLSTITEFIYVPNEVKDDNYLLNLQIAAFMSDASPSRPRLFSLEKI